MTHSVRTGLRLRGLIVGVTALVLLASPAFARDDQQHAAKSSSATQGPSNPPPPDFLLGRPRTTFGVRGSWFMASAGSDFYDTVISQLDLEKSSFRTASVSFEGGFSLTPQLDIVAGVDLNRVNRGSQDRRLEELLADGTRVPIEQTTRLSEKNVYASAKFSLVPRGRAVSRLAWIPRTFVPYVGAGAGIGHYNLLQNGDFVDFTNNHIFSDTFRSDGWAPSVHVMGGSDIQVYRRMMISIEGRYTWQHGTLSNDFVNFDPLDLGGLRIGAGLHVAF